MKFIHVKICLIDSLLYGRRKKIDKIACSNNIQLNIDDITDIINSIKLDDRKLEGRLAQTERNINLILDGTVGNFTIDDVKSIKEISEVFKYRIEYRDSPI